MLRKFLFLSFFALTAGISFAQTVQEFYDKGVALKKEGNVKDAIESFKQATKLDPNHKQSWYEMGWCHNDLKEYNSAIFALSRSRSLNYQYAALYFELGYAFQKTMKNDSARACYDKCLQINPEYSLVSKQLGYMAYDDNDNAAAIKHFQRYEQLTKLAIKDYLYWYRKGFCNNALKLYDSAKVALNKSLEFKTDYINTYLELGFASSRLKQNEEAIAFYNKAIALDPKSHVGYNGIAEVYRDNYKNVDEALTWYKKTLGLNVNERKANFGVGYCLNSKGQYSEAISYLKKAIELEPTYVAAYSEVGYSYYMTNSNTLALENLKKAMSLSPSNENSRYYAGLVYIQQKEKELAQKMVDELKGLNSKQTASLQEKVNKM